jgi:hypothetical protein
MHFLKLTAELTLQDQKRSGDIKKELQINNITHKVQRTKINGQKIKEQKITVLKGVLNNGPQKKRNTERL